ncbi:MAG TPA: Pycsar system effector family protein [Candidatus Angelobacter sp.]|nr:Pycsar system effector family protein [Candidatus Angelobacter sp.]
MEQRLLIDAAKDQLNRTLGFFPRVDAKASVLLAVNTGMLGLLIANCPPIRAFNWAMLVVLLPIGPLTVSYWFLYKEAFPRLEGGPDSLIYFREIAKRKESKFIDQFKNQTQDSYLADLLSQIWRNSEILKAKFDDVRLAFNSTALAIFPWVVALAMLVSKNTALKSLISK